LTSTRTTTPSITLTLTLTFTRVPTLTRTVTSSATANPTPTITATAGAEGTVFEIKDVIIYPNPVFGTQNTFYVDLNVSHTPQSIMMKIYTAAFRAIRTVEWTTGIKRGDNFLSVPMSKLGHISNGTYYYVIIAKDLEGRQAKSRAGELIILR
jgi:hypothetical protein